MKLEEVESKYRDFKEELNKHPLINFLGRNYQRLKKYYHGELERLSNLESS